jgi:hypothetical protein
MSINDSHKNEKNEKSIDQKILPMVSSRIPRCEPPNENPVLIDYVYDFPISHLSTPIQLHDMIAAGNTKGLEKRSKVTIRILRRDRFQMRYRRRLG